MDRLVMRRFAVINKALDCSGFEITFIMVILLHVMLHVNLPPQETNFWCFIIALVTSKKYWCPILQYSVLCSDQRSQGIKVLFLLYAFIMVGFVVLLYIVKSFHPKVTILTILKEDFLSHFHVRLHLWTICSYNSFQRSCCFLRTSGFGLVMSQRTWWPKNTVTQFARIFKSFNMPFNMIFCMLLDPCGVFTMFKKISTILFFNYRINLCHSARINVGLMFFVVLFSVHFQQLWCVWCKSSIYLLMWSLNLWDVWKILLHELHEYSSPSICFSTCSIICRVFTVFARISIIMLLN